MADTLQSWRAARDQLAFAQKPGGGVPAYMRWINRGLARPVAAAAYVAGLTPNLVTAFSAFSSLAGLACLLLLPRSILAGVLVAVLLALGFVLDSADGQLARLRGGGSGAGEWLDHVVDAARTCLVHLSVTVALLLAGAPLGWAVVGLAFCTVAVTQFFSQILAEQLLARRGPRTRAAGGGSDLQSWILLPTDTGVLCWSFALWGWVGGFEAWYGLLAAIASAHLLLSLQRRYRDLVTTPVRQPTEASHP